MSSTSGCEFISLEAGPSRADFHIENTKTTVSSFYGCWATIDSAISLSESFPIFPSNSSQRRQFPGGYESLDARKNLSDQPPPAC
jgi:hypothetical protein